MPWPTTCIVELCVRAVAENPHHHFFSHRQDADETQGRRARKGRRRPVRLHPRIAPPARAAADPLFPPPRNALQYKIRRDPLSYRDDFLKQWNQYASQREIFLISPSTATPDSVEAFYSVLDMIAHVSNCYPAETASFPDDLRNMLSQHHAVLHPDLREKMVGSLCLLRRKDVIDPSTLLTTLFPILVSSPSKTMRALLFSKITMELRNSNAKATNHPLNRTVQTVLQNLITADRTSPKALWAIKLTREMWKRQIWTDAKPVQVMKEACLADNEKVVAGGVRFFLGGDKEREDLEDEESDHEQIDLRKVKHQIGINKKTKKKERMFDKAMGKVKRNERRKAKPHPLNFSALHLLHDPQGFAELLFSKHLQSHKVKLSLDTRLLVLQLVTRLVGLHELTIVNLYSWFTKYLTPRQQQVTTYLACLAQATHRLVPPDAIEPLLVKIANEFVSEGSAAEVAAAGLNAIRETCVRQPLAMSDALLQDLVQYRKSKDKGVVMAARGLLSLYREVGADLLARKDRGRDAAFGLRSGEIKQKRFGESAPGQIEGLDLLEKWKAEQRAAKAGKKGGDGQGGDGDDDEDEDGWNSDEWEAGSGWSDSEGSGGWIDVSEDEGPPAKRVKTTKESKPTRAAEDGEGGEGEGADGEEAPELVEAGSGDEDEGDESGGADEEEDDGEDEDEGEDEDGGSDEDEDGGADSDSDDSLYSRGEKEDADGEDAAADASNPPDASTSIHNLATTTILTPADLAKLQELRMAADVSAAMGMREREKRKADAIQRHVEDGLTAEQIELPGRLYAKMTKEERNAHVRDGKFNREEHKSTQAIRRSKKEAEGKSTTNKEKARKKHMLMTLGKAKAKNKRSLAMTSKILKGHVERSKRGGRRGTGRK
jgi:protein SDA1